MKYFVCFLCIAALTLPLKSQNWQLIEKSVFLNSSLSNLTFFLPWDMTIYNDTLLFSLFHSPTNDTCIDIVIYNKNNGDIKFIYSHEIKNMINQDTNNQNFVLYSLDNIRFDRDASLWGSAIQMIFKLKNDSIILYKQVYDSRFNAFFDIYNVSDIYIDDNNLWSIILYKCADTIYYYNKSLCIYRNNRFETIDYPTFDCYGGQGGNSLIAIDKLGNIWRTQCDTLYKFNRDLELIKKICVQEFPQGSGFYTQLLFDNKNTLYALCNNLNLYIYDGSNFYTDTTLASYEIPYYYEFEGSKKHQMCMDSIGNIWFSGTFTCNLYRLDTSHTWKVFPINIIDTLEDNCQKETMECDKYGRIWIAGSKGLYIFDPNGTSPVEEPPTMTESGALPDVWLYNLYPNPADGSTTIEFFLARAQKQTLNASVCSILGERTLNITPLLEYDDYNQRGKITFSTDGLAGGAYFVLVSAGDTKKLKLLMVAK
jgi:hypothetical protein